MPVSRFCLTHAGVGDSTVRGFAEQAVQSFEGMLRVHTRSIKHEDRAEQTLTATR